jgi:hypothetical protein
MGDPNIEIRGYRPGDEVPILDCFHRVFGADTPEGKLRTMERWRWQVVQNPAPGAREAILLAVDSGAPGVKVVGQFAGVPVRMHDRGAEKIGMLAVDLMVDPQYRRGLRKPGLFGNLGAEWFRRVQGPGRHELVYGFPNLLSFRIGNAVLRYEVVRTQVTLFREGLTPLLAGRGVEVERVEKAGPEFDALFDRLAPDLRILVRRDAAYLQWRYLTHPDFRYELYAARDRQGLRGFAVVRVCDWLVPNNCVIADWFVPGGDVDAARELLRRVEEVRARAGSPALSIVVPDNNPWFRDLQSEGFLVAPTDYVCCVVAGGRAYAPSTLRREWFYTHGDFDHL